MRKSMFYSMLGMAALFLVNGCQKPAEEAPDPVINLEVTEGRYEVPAAGGEVKIAYSVENPVEGVSLKVSAAPNDWATGFKADGTNIVFNVAPKLDLDAERTVDVTASYTGAKDVTFTLVQVPDDASKRPSLKVDPSTYEASAEGGPGSVKYTLTNPVEDAELSVALADAEDSWVSNLAINETDGTVTFDVAENEAIRERSAVVNITYSVLSNPVSFTIVQSGKEIESQVNPNWTVKYSGKQELELVDGSTVTYDVVTVTVSAGTDTYLTGLCAVSDFDKLEGGIDEYIESMIDMYSEEAATSGWDKMLSSETGDSYFGPLSASVQYYAIAFGVDNTGKSTGLYAVSEAFTPDAIQIEGGYENWLGDWKYTGQNGISYTLTVEQNPADPTKGYLITGWQPGLFQQPVPIRGEYDSEYGYLNFIADNAIADCTVTDAATKEEVDCSLALFGIGDDGKVYSMNDGDEIAAALLNGSTASVAGYTYTDMQQNEFTMVKMMLVAVPKNDPTVYYPLEDDADIANFPGTMTKIQSSGSATAMSVARDIKALDSKIKASVSGTTTAMRMNSANMARIAR